MGLLRQSGIELNTTSGDPVRTGNPKQADWYIDAVNGSDANDGASAAKALKSWEEFQHRCDGLTFEQDTTVHILSDLDEALFGEFFGAESYILTIIGEAPTTIHTDTVATYTAPNPAGNEAGLLTASGVSDWTSVGGENLIGHRVRMTSGAAAGAVFGIATEDPDSAGVDVARVGPAATYDETARPLGGTTNTTSIAPGDTFVVERLPVVSGGFGITYKVRDTTGTSIRVAQLVDLDFPLGSSHPAILDSGGSLTAWNLYRCRFSGTGAQIGSSTGMIAQEANIYLGFTRFSDAIANAAIGNFLIVPSSTGNSTMVMHMSCSITDPAVLQGGRMWLVGNEYLRARDPVGIFDSPSSGILMESGWEFEVEAGGKLYGKGHAQFGVDMQPGCLLKYTSASEKPTITGTAGDVQIGPATFPYSSLPSWDGEQRGTATLVGGTVTVSGVVLHDVANRKITLTHNTPGGTPGILSAPQASRAAGQFVINSESGTDTSTVDWKIEGLGVAAGVVEGA